MVGSRPLAALRVPDHRRSRRRPPSLVGHINHSAGLRFVNVVNGHTLKLTNFRIQISAHPGLTAAVNGDPKARVRILNLDLSTATIVKHPPRR